MWVKGMDIKEIPKENIKERTTLPDELSGEVYHPTPAKEMSNFDVKHNREIEKAGGFWCHACLVSHPATEQSPDPRYCQGCYDFLHKEAEMLPRNKRPAWIPKSQKARKKQYQVSQVRGGIMSTLESKEIEGLAFIPSSREITAWPVPAFLATSS